MKFSFPYSIAAELWLFGPPARKQTIFHLFILIAVIGVGISVFLLLEDSIGRFLSVLAAVVPGFITGYLIHYLFSLGMPFLRWLVSRGWIEPPDEEKFKAKIIWTACWENTDSRK